MLPITLAGASPQKGGVEKAGTNINVNEYSSESAAV